MTTEPKPVVRLGRVPEDFTGKTFGSLVVVRNSGKKGKGKVKATIYSCRCVCGKMVDVPSYRFKHQNPKTHCGCLNKGHSVNHKREYNVWSMMLVRCNDPGHVAYKDYGGRGIKVCERWEADFLNFLEDMGPRPRGMTLDRKDNDLGYFKDNCRWATKDQQSWNKRTTVYVEHPETGERMPAGQLAKEWKVSFQIMRYRMIKLGKWPGKAKPVDGSAGDLPASAVEGSSEAPAPCKSFQSPPTQEAA